jgi:hypothetical protein
MHYHLDANRFFKNALRFILLAALVISGGCSGSSGDSSTHPAPGPIAPYLIFSTYLGGKTSCDSCSDPFTFALNTASDSSGNTYLTGLTQVKDLPIRNAYQAQPASGSSKSAFIVKYSLNGQILWGTYLGGNEESLGIGIAAMPDGGVAVAGITTSHGSVPFPIMNAFQNENNGNGDYFVTVFDKDGNLRYSTYLGGSQYEGEQGAQFADDSSNGNNIATDAQGLVYVTGITTSSHTLAKPFPITSNAVQRTFGGDVDAFLVIIDPYKSGTDSLVYSSFIGGSGHEKGHGIAVRPSGSNVTVVGYTDSINFPTTDNGYRKEAAPKFTSNGFVAQFSSSAPGETSSVYSKTYATYLGGKAESPKPRDDCYGVSLDPSGIVVITGRTVTPDFPMLDSTYPSIYNSAPYLGQYLSNDEPYLTKIDTSKSGAASLVYSTFLGGGSTTGSGSTTTGGGFCSAVAVDSNGVSYVVGETSAQGTLYQYSSIPAVAPQTNPYTGDALFTSNQGGDFDAMNMQISTDGSTLRYSTFLGGSASDRGYGAAVDPSNNIVISGLTYSTDFPLVNPAQTWPGNTNHMNAFVAKIGRRF